MPKPQLPRSPWRIVRRTLFALALLVLLPVLAWWIVNRIDESPSSEAMRYAAESPRKVADSDNGWLYLAGIGAAATEDPRDYAHRRIAAMDARLKEWPKPEADPAERALFVDATPAVGPDAAIDGDDALCPVRDTDCIEWAGQRSAMLERLRAANALRLQRWQALQLKPDWQALYPPGNDAPVPDASVAALHLDLIALDLARVPGAANSQATRALESIADFVAFWRRVQAHPQDVHSTLLAGRQVEHAQRLASAWLDRHPVAPASDGESALDRILGPPTVPTDWSEAMRHEFQAFASTTATAVPGPLGALRRCIAGTASDSCLTTILSNAAYAHQATLNLHATHRTLMQRVLEADPRELPAVNDEVGRAFEQTFVRFDDTGVLLRQLGYNFAGRILAQVAVPAFDWGKRGHDQEAVRRMIVLKREALRAGLSRDAMPGFLATQSKALANPYDGEAFGWDAQSADIVFAPMATTYWERTPLRVRFHP